MKTGEKKNIVSKLAFFWLLLTLILFGNIPKTMAQQGGWQNWIDYYLNPCTPINSATTALRECIPDLYVKGFIQNETGVNLYPDRVGYDFNRILWRTELDLDYHFTNVARFRIIANYLNDSVFGWSPGDPSNPVSAGLSARDREQLSNYWEWSQIVREVYFEDVVKDVFTTGDDIWFRLGKQQVTWGNIPGRRVTDFINPLDSRLVIDTSMDYEHWKIPLWMTNVEWEKWPFHTQFLLIPKYEPDYNPPQGAPWAWYPPAKPAIILPAENPKDGNLQVGFRGGFYLKGYDFNALFFHTYQTTPSYFWKELVGRNLIIQPRAERQDNIGFSVENNYNFWQRNWAVKLEGYYTPSKYFSDSAQSPRFIDLGQRGYDRAHYALWDWSIDTTWPWEITTQFILVGEHVWDSPYIKSLVIFPTKDPLDRNRIEANFYIRKPFKITDDKLIFTSLTNWEEHELGKNYETLEYDLDRTTFMLTYERMWGASEPLFEWPAYRNHDQILFSIKWTFGS